MIKQKFADLKDWYLTCREYGMVVIIEILDDQTELYIAFRDLVNCLHCGYYKIEKDQALRHEEGLIAESPEEYTDWVEESDRAIADESQF